MADKEHTLDEVISITVHAFNLVNSLRRRLPEDTPLKAAFLIGIAYADLEAAIKELVANKAKN